MKRMELVPAKQFRTIWTDNSGRSILALDCFTFSFDIRKPFKILGKASNEDKATAVTYFISLPLALKYQWYFTSAELHKQSVNTKTKHNKKEKIMRWSI